MCSYCSRLNQGNKEVQVSAFSPTAMHSRVKMFQGQMIELILLYDLSDLVVTSHTLMAGNNVIKLIIMFKLFIWSKGGLQCVHTRLRSTLSLFSRLAPFNCYR